jgi:hypothetical protein
VRQSSLKEEVLLLRRQWCQESGGGWKIKSERRINDLTSDYLTSRLRVQGSKARELPVATLTLFLHVFSIL